MEKNKKKEKKLALENPASKLNNLLNVKFNNKKIRHS